MEFVETWPWVRVAAVLVGLKNDITRCPTKHAWPRNLNQPASGKLGAVRGANKRFGEAEMIRGAKGINRLEL